jgi:phi13 family phage major tail protein
MAGGGISISMKEGKIMSSEYGELVNLDNLYYAKVLNDSADSYQTDTNKYLAPAAEMKKEAKVDATPRYYDGKAMFVSPTEASTDVTLTVSGVPSRLAAELTGKPYDVTRGLMIDTGDVSNAPYYALSARAELGDGGYRFYQFLKGRFSLGAETAKTKEEKVTASTVELTYTGLVTIHEFAMPDGSKSGAKGVQADTTDAAFTGAGAWFSQVQTPETLGKPAELTMSSIAPASGTTGVLATANVVLMFSNAIASHSVKLVDNVTDAIVPAAYTFDSTGKILTINPTGNMTAGDKHAVAIFGVKDVYGQSLADSLSYFTVAS